jgi:FtsZ-binding cell division protein ZapB
MRAQYLCITCCGFLLLILFYAGCALNGDLVKPDQDRKFVLETSRLEELAREGRSTSIRAKSHLQLAFLYVDSRNPQLNYSRALTEMETYFSMSPDRVQRDDYKNWHLVLREVDRVRKDTHEVQSQNNDLQNQVEHFRISLERIQETNRTLREQMVNQQEEFRRALGKAHEANKSLRAKLANLQGVIERLKTLDYQMEKQRDRIK